MVSKAAMHNASHFEIFTIDKNQFSNKTFKNSIVSRGNFLHKLQLRDLKEADKTHLKPYF